MQVTTNVITLPSSVLDNYLECLAASITPILKEEGISAVAQASMLRYAVAAVVKSVCVNNLSTLEGAGLFEGVKCIELPDFQWSRGSKLLYAYEMLIPSIVKTMAEQLAAGERNVQSYMDMLSAIRDINTCEAVEEALEKASGPSAKRLENHIDGIAQVNYTLMLGMTSGNILRVLNSVIENTEPLASLEEDLNLLVPTPLIYL